MPSNTTDDRSIANGWRIGRFRLEFWASFARHLAPLAISGAMAACVPTGFLGSICYGDAIEVDREGASMGIGSDRGSNGYATRAVMVGVALLAAALGWLAWRHGADAGLLPWILGGCAIVMALIGLFAPLRWVRIVLGMNLFTQDAVRD